MIEDRSDELREWYGEDNPDGAGLLDELQDTFTKYVVFSGEHAANAVTLWTATTHALPAFEHAPRLALTSPEKRCAKSRTLDIITGTCHRPLVSVNATVAAIYRSLVGDHPPTLVIDEADALFGTKRAAEQNEDLRALLNAGHQRGRPALRCVGPQQIPTEFPTFAMAALAAIGGLPDTVTDRAVNVGMRRRASGEKVSQFRSRRDGPILKSLQERLARWAAEHLEQLKTAEPEMPVEDRAADTWEPLIAVADAAGGHWPETARAACKALVAGAADADQDTSQSARLLSDIKQIFTSMAVPFLSSAELVSELRKVEESPWDDYELNPRKLASRLRPFGVKPGHNTTKSARGYPLEALTDAFTRYLRPEPSEPSETVAEQEQRRDGPNRTDGTIRPDKITRPDETTGQTLFWTNGTVPDAPPDENGSDCRFCGTELRLPSATARGYCSRPNCLTRARQTAVADALAGLDGPAT